MENKRISLSVLEEFSPSTAGQDILRYVNLPDFLGSEKETLLYYLGKNLARQLDITSLDDIPYIFNKLQWGQLDLIKDKRNQMIFHLMADTIVHKLQASIPVDFRMESGFLAEAIQLLTERVTECTEITNERLYRVEFKVLLFD